MDDDVTQPRGRNNGRREVEAGERPGPSRRLLENDRPSHDDTSLGGHESLAGHESPGWYVPEIDDVIVLSLTADSADGYAPGTSPLPDDVAGSGPVGVEVEGLDDLNL